jgi:predicted amidohydrolase YtcJ
MLKPLLSLALLAGCSATRAAPSAPATLIHNGRIYLGAPEWTCVEALLVRDGRVVAAGTEAELERGLTGVDERIDLGGAIAVPGLQDAHGHLEGYGESLESVDLRDARSLAELVERVRQRASTRPPGTWILGRGWDQTLWPGGEFPEHAALSAAVPDHPVFLKRVDGHAAFVNARALELAGLEGDLTTRASGLAGPGGSIRLDSNGRASGVLVDGATRLVSQRIPPPDRDTRRRRLLLAQERLLAFGLTAVHDMGVTPEGLGLLRELRDEGRWKLRAVEYLWGNEGVPPDWRPLAPDARDVLCAPGVKLMIDGALGSRGAALLEPYADAPRESGLLMLTPEELAERVEACARQGLQPAVHAIGDRGNRLVLDAYERAAVLTPDFRDLRPRVEHAQVVSSADWTRFAALSAIPSMQPTHATSDMRWAEQRLGPERVLGAYAWRRLDSPRAPLALGSDFPVESPNPLEGLYAARTRQDRDGSPAGGFQPDQRLSAREALAGFTAGAAFAVHQEDRRGALRPGYFADLTVLDVDPLEAAPSALLGARVKLTILSGEVVFRAASE